MSSETSLSHRWLRRDVQEQIMRRRPGTLHPHTNFDPKSAALLVIDMQTGFVDADNYGATALVSARGIVENINRLGSALRRAGGSVIWVISSYPEEPSRLPFKHAVSRESAKLFCRIFAEGREGHTVWHELERKQEDATVSKNSFAAFYGSGEKLTKTLKSKLITTVLISGVQTSICCETTLREAVVRDFKAIMVEDGNAGRIAEENDATYSIVLRAFGDVLSTDFLVRRCLSAT